MDWLRRNWKLLSIALVVIALVMIARHMAPRERRPHPHYASYWQKPARYLIMDGLILSSPLNALIAVLFMFDPTWRERPRDRAALEESPPHFRAAVRRNFLIISFFLTLAGLGVAIYIAHVLDLIS
jgi:hypothetical protein